MVSYTISHQAYLKIFFHAAKHPHQPVNGVLLGEAANSGVIITDAVPLLHHWTSLSPMMEIGLDLVSVAFTHAYAYPDIDAFPPDRRVGSQTHLDCC